MMIPMAPETESLVQEHLRHIRGAVDALREDNREIKTRLGILEHCRTGSTALKVASIASKKDWNWRTPKSAYPPFFSLYLSISL
jgi:hypothetical protein